MSSDEVHAFTGVAERVQELEAKATRLMLSRDHLASDKAEKEAEVKELGEQIEKLAKVNELLRLLLDKLVEKQVNAVEDIVTEGLQTIFHDQVLSFEAEVGQYRNQTSIEFFIRQGLKEDPLSHRGKPLDAFGGGPSSVASLTLRLLTVLRLKLWPFLALDETLAAVSDEYVDATGRFLQSLATTMGIDTLLVTHKQSFLDHADAAYRCTQDVEDDGTRRINIRSLK